MSARDTITRERTENAAGWRYEIQHGPDGETSYAWVYDDQNNHICVAKTHHAIAIVQRMNAAAGHTIVAPADMEKAAGPVPTHECPFHVGQPVRLANPYAEEDPEAVFYVTGIAWEHRRVSARGWNIMIASKEDIEKGYGQTDGFAPDDLLSASPHMPVPAGWQLVPEEPMTAMQNAGWREIDNQGFQTEDTEVAPIYRAMLSSAPKPAALTQEPKP